MSLTGRRRTGLGVAGAPISWGVCEVPGWGYQLPAERVLTEMERVGLAATEFGPAGFLPEEPAARKLFLDSYSVQAIGGVLPVLRHDADHDPMPGVDEFTGSVDLAAMLRALSGAGCAGWYVLEQDVMFKHGAPDGDGPVSDVRACLEFAEEVLA